MSKFNVVGLQVAHVKQEKVQVGLLYPPLADNILGFICKLVSLLAIIPSRDFALRVCVCLLD